MVRSAGGGAACGDGSPGRGSNPGAPGLPQPSQWVKLVNRAETQAEWDAMRLGVQRSQPLGSESWVENPGAPGFSVWSPRCVLAHARESKTDSEIRPVRPVPYYSPVRISGK